MGCPLRTVRRSLATRLPARFPILSIPPTNLGSLPWVTRRRGTSSSWSTLNVASEPGLSARAWRHLQKENDMNPKPETRNGDDMLPEYDFSHAVRGKYYDQYRQGTNLVLLDPDVAEVFPNATSVNDALR